MHPGSHFRAQHKCIHRDPWCRDQQAHQSLFRLTQPLRGQGIFVEQLYGSGMIDESEKDALLEPIERSERRLLRHGAMGRSTMVYEVRTGHPGFSGCPTGFIRVIWS